MPHLILIRHGQTDWNLKNLLQGTSDVALNDMGREQARQLALRLADEKLELILSSDLARAWDTASIVAECHDLEPVAEPRLRETGFGAFEGLTWPEIRASYPDVMEAWHRNPYSVTPPGGEPITETVSRLEDLLAELRQKPAEMTILLSGHGAIMRSLIALAIGLPQAHRWSLSLGQTSVTRMDLTPTRAVLRLLNDTGHLDSASALHA